MKFNDPEFMHRLEQKKKELELAKAQYVKDRIDLESAVKAVDEAESKHQKALDAVYKMQDELWGFEKESSTCNK